MAVLAGLMPEEPAARHAGRPVSDLVLEFSGPPGRSRTASS